MNNENTYSVNETINNLTEKLSSVEKQIKIQESIMKESPKQTEKQYIELTRLNALKDQLKVEINKLKEKNFINENMAKEDTKLNKTNLDIQKVSNKLNKSKYKFVNEFRNKKLKRLKNKKARIESKQRRLVNSYLKKAYKEFQNYAKIEGEFTGKNKYYDVNIAENTTKAEQFNSKITDNKGLHKVTNKYYQLRALPYELKKERFKSLKNKNIINYGSKHSNKLDLVQMRNEIIKMHKAEKAMPTMDNNSNIEENKVNNIISFNDFVERRNNEENKVNNIINFNDFVERRNNEENKVNNIINFNDFVERRNNEENHKVM